MPAPKAEKGEGGRKTEDISGKECSWIKGGVQCKTEIQYFCNYG